MIRAFHNMPVGDFIRDLRDAAIKGGMKTAFINMIDELNDPSDWEKQCEELGDKLTDAEKDRDDLLEELETLCTAIDENLDPDACKEVERAHEFALKAIERHSK